MKKSAYNEEEVLSMLQQEETQRQAFEKIVNKYSEQLYWQVRRMVNSHDDANDLMQNVFIKAWLNIDNFRGESRISTWLYRIASNECITFINKKKNEQNISLSDPDAEIAREIEGDAYFNGKSAEGLLQRALSTLPEKQRIVFTLKYFKEMKYETMSKILDTSVGALKASYHIAVKKIATFVEEDI
jgi:RNA polymerase sigma-70 factor, ECF subfamily